MVEAENTIITEKKPKQSSIAYENRFEPTGDLGLDSMIRSDEEKRRAHINTFNCACTTFDKLEASIRFPRRLAVGQF